MKHKTVLLEVTFKSNPTVYNSKGYPFFRPTRIGQGHNIQEVILNTPYIRSSWSLNINIEDINEDIDRIIKLNGCTIDSIKLREI